MAFKTIQKKRLASNTECVIEVSETQFDRHGNECSYLVSKDVLSAENVPNVDADQFSLEAQLAGNQPLKRVNTRILLDNAMPSEDQLAERVIDNADYEE